VTEALRSKVAVFARIIELDARAIDPMFKRS